MWKNFKKLWCVVAVALMLLLFSVSSSQIYQLNNNTVNDSNVVHVGKYLPPQTVVFHFNNKKLTMDFSSDTMTVYGDLSYDKAANLFFKYLKVGVLTKLDSLNILRENLKNCKGKLPNKTTALIDTNLTFKFNDYKVRATINVGSDTLYIKDPSVIVIYDTLGWVQK